MIGPLGEPPGVGNVGASRRTERQDVTEHRRLLLRISDVLERCGDHADARQMQRRALDLIGGVAPRDPAQMSGLGRLADF